MARVTQLVVRVENKQGELARVCSELAVFAVTISAGMAFHDREPAVPLVATPVPAAKKVLDQMGLSYREEDAVAVRVNDRPGALGRITRKLGEKGINIEYAYGSIVKGA